MFVQYIKASIAPHLVEPRHERLLKHTFCLAPSYFFVGHVWIVAGNVKDATYCAWWTSGSPVRLFVEYELFCVDPVLPDSEIPRGAMWPERPQVGSCQPPNVEGPSACIGSIAHSASPVHVHHGGGSLSRWTDGGILPYSIDDIHPCNLETVDKIIVIVAGEHWV